MYRKDSEGWLKHGDFIVLDMLCLQLAFIWHMHSVGTDSMCMEIFCIEIWQYFLALPTWW